MTLNNNSLGCLFPFPTWAQLTSETILAKQMTARRGVIHAGKERSETLGDKIMYEEDLGKKRLRDPTP